MTIQSVVSFASPTGESVILQVDSTDTQPVQTVLKAGTMASTANSLVVSADNPGVVSSTSASVTNTFATMSGGVLVGSLGQVTIPAGQTVSGGFLYGQQGKVVVQGTLSVGSTVSVDALHGSLDLSAATLSGGNLSIIGGDCGASAPTVNLAGFNYINLVNVTNATANAYMNFYGKADFMITATLNGSMYYEVAGSSPGSAGDPTKCNATNVWRVKQDTIILYIPLFDQNT